MLIKAIFFGQNAPLTLVVLKGYTVSNSVCNEESNQNIKSYLTLMIFVQVLYNRASEVVNILICKSWNVVQYGDILVLEFFVWNQYRTIWNVEVIWRISPSNFLLDPFLQTQTSEKNQSLYQNSLLQNRHRPTKILNCQVFYLQIL